MEGYKDFNGTAPFYKIIKQIWTYSLKLQLQVTVHIQVMRCLVNQIIHQMDMVAIIHHTTTQIRI